MTVREIKKILKENGWSKVREGRHEVWGKDGIIIPIPRHKGDLPRGTTDSILKRAGLK